MKSSINVRRLSDAEQKVMETGLRSSNALVLRRCQILLASGRGERVPVIAQALSCDEQTVRIALHLLPTKSRWLNPTEVKWGHCKKNVVEADQLLTDSELERQVYVYFACSPQSCLSKPEKVT